MENTILKRHFFEKVYVYKAEISYLCSMELHFKGVILAVCTFLIIGIFHPVIIKTEYYFGTKPWWIFLIGGIISIGAAMFVANILWSSILGVIGASMLWSIGELFEQKERVKKGWFPKNPKRLADYEDNHIDDK